MRNNIPSLIGIACGTAVRAFAAGLLVVSAGASSAQDCNADNWKACAGKPWVTGNSMATPIGDIWWPNKQWGAGDEAGASNYYTKPEIVMRAVGEVKTGKVYKLGQTYHQAMPFFGQRSFALRIPGSPTGGPLGAANMVYNDEFVAADIGQIGTQFDGLGHIGVAINGPADKSNIRYYNGVTQLEIESGNGLRKNGIEKLHPIVARGIMIDVAAAKGVESLEAGYEITVNDVMQALERQGMKDFKFMPGDGVFFRTGWMKYWGKDNAKFNSGAPGIGMAIAKWLSDVVQAGVTGTDNWATDVVPNPDPGCVFCAHTHLITRHGILNHESMVLDELSRDKVYRFMYMFSPLPLQGATGSPGAAVAVR